MNKKENRKEKQSHCLLTAALSELKLGECAVIEGISMEAARNKRERLLDLGFVKGAPIAVRNVSPLGDPVAYLIHDTTIALRHEDARSIQITIDKK